jgi:hypothetical protein
VQAPPRLAKACNLLGLPKKDHKWVKLSSHECVHFLVTEYIDFFDPRLKCAPAAATQKAKANLAGDMRKMIATATGAEVICIQHVTEYI